MAEKIRILFLAANPVDASYRLLLDEEAREIGENLRASSNRDAFEVISQWTVRPSDLQVALLKHKPQIVHFSGHGSNNKGITLEDRDGDMTPVSTQALVGLFAVVKDKIRIVFLNACQSQRQINSLCKVIDFTIAMNATMGDQTAVIFASHFYQSLAFGRSVSAAFELARNQLALERIDESKMPVLLQREGVDASTYLINGTEAVRAHRSGAEAPSSESALQDSRSFRSVKSPAKPGSVPSAVVARAVRMVANERARSGNSKTSEPHKSKR